MNCRSSNNFGHGWEIGCGNNSFVACSSNTNGQAASNTYSGFKTTSVGNSFAGCFSKNVTWSVKYAFEDTVSGAFGVNTNQYSACRGEAGTAPFSMAAFAGASPTIGASPQRPTANTAIPSVAGTSFLDLSVYTAPTRRDEFTNGATGQRLYLLGSANVTLKNNTTIKT